MRRAAVVALLVLSALSPALAQRLPLEAVPLHYQLTFAPDLAAERFTGEEVIDLRLDKPTARITLHAVSLQVDEAVVVRNSAETPAAIAFDAAQEWLVLTMPSRIPAGVCKLRLKFAGPLTESMAGLYLSRANGRKYAVTQFQATDARRAFPCFDEPALKASFTISAIVDERDTAISNGRVLSDTPGPVEGKHTLRFTTTPKMSTELVALAVGDFACSDGASDGIPIRACATPDKKDLTRFAVDAAENILRYINGYLTIRYPFRKLDLVAIPDFAAGAMENTAAIFFRESNLLLDESTASPERAAGVAGVIAHEIAHQWFGNLVTCAWWDDLWLNEGFASWMEPKALSAWKPQWRTGLAAQARTDRVMSADASGHTRAVKAVVATRAEIDDAFDPIVYDKAAGILRMMEGYAGPEVFRSAVNAYLRAHTYATATSEDFWSTLATTARLPADRILRSFVELPGVPAVSVGSACPNDAETAVSLSQRRFTLGRPPDAAASTWSIPVEVRPLSAAGAVPTPALLDGPTGTLGLGGCAPLLANAGARGYYLTVYSPDALARVAAVAPAMLTPAERVGLVDNEWALVRGGVHDTTVFLALAEALSGDRVPEVLEAVAGPLAFIHDVLVPPARLGAFEAWVRRIFGARMAELGWDRAASDDDARERQRDIVIATLASVGRDPEAAAKARALALQAAAARPNAGRPVTGPPVLRAAASAADQELMTALLTAASRGSSPERQALFRDALSGVSSADSVSQVLGVALSSGMRSRDTLDLIEALLASPAAARPAWAFLTSHWTDVSARLSSLSAIPTLVAATSGFCDADTRASVAAFFEKKVSPGSPALPQALEQIDACREMKAREAARLEGFLKRP